MPAWTSAGVATRAVAEKLLTNVEQQRMLRNNNQITTTFMQEKDARSQEVDDLNLKLADLKFKEISAKASKKAADLAAITAALQLVGTIGKIAVSSRKNGNVNWGTAIGEIVNGIGNVVNKLLERLKAKEEIKAVERDRLAVNRIKSGADKAVAALDANPYG